MRDAVLLKGTKMWLQQTCCEILVHISKTSKTCAYHCLMWLSDSANKLRNS